MSLLIACILLVNMRRNLLNDSLSCYNENLLCDEENIHLFILNYDTAWSGK